MGQHVVNSRNPKPLHNTTIQCRRPPSPEGWGIVDDVRQQTEFADVKASVAGKTRVFVMFQHNGTIPQCWWFNVYPYTNGQSWWIYVPRNFSPWITGPRTRPMASSASRGHVHTLPGVTVSWAALARINITWSRQFQIRCMIVWRRPTTKHRISWTNVVVDATGAHTLAQCMSENRTVHTAQLLAFLNQCSCNHILIRMIHVVIPWSVFWCVIWWQHTAFTMSLM